MVLLLQSQVNCNLFFFSCLEMNGLEFLLIFERISSHFYTLEKS